MSNHIHRPPVGARAGTGAGAGARAGGGGGRTCLSHGLDFSGQLRAAVHVLAYLLTDLLMTKVSISPRTFRAVKRTNHGPSFFHRVHFRWHRQRSHMPIRSRSCTFMLSALAYLAYRSPHEPSLAHAVGESISLAPLSPSTLSRRARPKRRRRNARQRQESKSQA